MAVEPFTANNRVNAVWNANDWKRIIKETSERVKETNPQIKVGAIMSIADFNVFDEIKDMPSLDVIGFNIYARERIYKGYADRKCSGDCVGEKLDEIKNYGKEAWIFETWSSRFRDANFNAEWRTEIDSKYMQVMYYYAQKHGAKNMMPFFSTKFVMSGTPFDFDNLEKSLKSGQRTTVFYEFKDIIEKARNSASIIKE